MLSTVGKINDISAAVRRVSRRPCGDGDDGGSISSCESKPVDLVPGELKSFPLLPPAGVGLGANLAESAVCVARRWEAARMPLEAFGVVLTVFRRRVSVIRDASACSLDFEILGGGLSISIAAMMSEPDSVGRLSSVFLVSLRRKLGDAGRSEEPLR